MPAAEIDARVAGTLEGLGVGALAERRPEELSGEEVPRIAGRLVG